MDRAARQHLAAGLLGIRHHCRNLLLWRGLISEREVEIDIVRAGDQRQEPRGERVRNLIVHRPFDQNPAAGRVGLPATSG